MPNNALVSIITPCYNAADFVSQTIESVLAQSYQNWELLLIDDGSKDKTVDIIQKYAVQDSRIKALHNTHEKQVRGPGAARNTGIEFATGRYIAFLDSDDLWTADKLKVQIDFMQNHNAILCYGWYELITADNVVVGQHTPTSPRTSYRNLLKDCEIGCLTAVYDTQFIGKQFIDMNNWDTHADYSLWLKITKQGHDALNCPQVLGQYRLISNSISANKFKAMKQQWLTLRIGEGLPFYKLFYYFTFYVIKGLIKKLKFIKYRK